MPSFGRYCQGVIRYRVACQTSADTSIILCKENLKGLRLWRCSATETLLSHFTQVRYKLPAQSAESKNLLAILISCYALAVSAEAWYSVLYPITPCTPRQYLQTQGRGLACYFYILSRLSSVCLGLAFYSISYHVLAVSADAWQAILISYHALAVSAEAWHAFLSYHVLAVSA